MIGLVDVMVFLAAAVVCVPIAQRLGLGSILGYLIAGVAIGPWGLRLVADVDTILHFSEFGVVLMLFVIGLELEFDRLWAMRADVFGGGALQLALSGAVLIAGAMALGLPWQPAVIAGFALALSSTAVAVQAMNERNLTPSPTGRKAFAVLLFQDMAAIPLLAAVPLLAGVHASPSEAWRRTLIVVAAIAGVLVIGRYLMRPLLRIIAATRIREMFTAFTLLIVIGIAQLMSLAGISMALGAFLAGVLLASSEFRHALETDIEPFKGLLLGLFFISVGMSIEFDLLRTAPMLIVVLLVGLLSFKLLTLWVVAWIMGVTLRQRWLFASLLAQGGEFAFVVFSTAEGRGLLTAEWTSRLTIAVALSMALTPLMLLLHDKLVAWRLTAAERAADAIDEGPAQVVIAGFGRFGQIVGRLLFANGVRAIVLDHDPEQIELLRRFGYKVFYGDATRLDLLRAAGAGQAKLLVNAIDDVADSVSLTARARESFPKLKIIARARNVNHYVQLREHGVEVIERETFESALRTGRHVLEALGVDRFRAREMADGFRRHNITTMEALVPLFSDEERVMSAQKAGREELREFFARDKAQFEGEQRKGWNRGLVNVLIHWTESGEARSAEWRSEAGVPPPQRVEVGDDRTSADAAFRLIRAGAAILWRGDYHNARLLLSALARRVDRPQRPTGSKRSGPAEATSSQRAFEQTRRAQARRAELLGRVLLPYDTGYVLPLRRAPDVRQACREAYGEDDAPFVASLRELLGIIGAHEWRKKGVEIAALGARVHPHYGVFAPVRQEYVDLVARAPLSSKTLAFDIGTGTGVLAAVLAKRGVAKVVATDDDPRALACATENIARLGFGDRVEVVRADLFPAGVAPLLVCNPPWVPATPSSRLERAVYDPESRMLRGYLAGLAAHLAPRGEGWLILSDLAEHLGLREREDLLTWIDQAGLRVVGRLEAKPAHKRAADTDDPLHAARAAEVTSLWRLAAG